MEQILCSEVAELSENEKLYFESIRVPLSLKELHWEYGDNELFQAWVFADFKERDVGAAYCSGGHGAFGSPWG